MLVHKKKENVMDRYNYSVNNKITHLERHHESTDVSFVIKKEK